MQPAVARAITLIRDRYADPITLEDLSAEVFVSPFHLTRIFRRATGVTPGRYLTAVRLFQAKRLLLTTNRTVSDIVGRVGYSSLGTFTSRFTKAVGLTPSQYRDPEVGQLLVAVAPEFARLPALTGVLGPARLHAPSPPGTGTVTTTVTVPPELGEANVVVGVFDDRIPQRAPVAFGTLPATGGVTRCEIAGVPPGQWSVLAVAERADRAGPLYVDAPTEPVTTAAGVTTDVPIGLRRLRPTDPPVAVTLTPPRPAAVRPLRVA